MKRRRLPLLFVLPLLVATGCPKTEVADKGPAGPPPGTTLRVLVVDDPLLAQSIGYLKSEWEAQSGVFLEISNVAPDEFNPQTGPEADVVIAPSWMLGPATEAGWVVPLPERVAQNNESDWSNIFPQIREHEVVRQGKTMAVPFGSPALVLCYRPDLLADANLKPPTTWAEYAKVCETLKDSSTAEPLAEGWAGLALLARSAPYATHPDNLSALFRISTMEPLIAGPPFVRGLEELVATADAASLEMDPAAVRAAFWQGKAAMAVTWPTAADEALAEIEPDFAAGIIELPGSPSVYDVGEATWEKRDKYSDGRVPLLASSGRLGMVTKTSQWPDASLQLLLWLTDEKWSGQVCSQSLNTTLFRSNHVETVAGWVEPPMSDETAQQYGEAITATLERQERLCALPIPGRPEYLAALDEAVRAAVKKEKSPQEALDTAAERWKQITQELGVDRQKAAYRASLGLK
jgi:multiple sugar transport system substrate-binding protein